MNPTLFVTYFDLDGTGRFLTILQRWFRAYNRSRCALPAVVLTNGLTHVPYELRATRQPVEARFRPLMRAGNVYDYKSALICSALPHLPAGAIVLDCDALFVADPTEALRQYTQELFAMPPDSGRRRIPYDSGIPEHSSSVMVFGEALALMRESIVQSYVNAWEWLSKHDDAKGQIDKIREQRAWSLVHHWIDGTLMDERLNWSASHYAPNPDALIVHHHGSAKLASR